MCVYVHISRGAYFDRMEWSIQSCWEGEKSVRLLIEERLEGDIR